MHVYIFLYTLTENFYNPQAGIFFHQNFVEYQNIFFFVIFYLWKKKNIVKRNMIAKCMHITMHLHQKNQRALDWKPSQFADKTQILTIGMVMHIERNACAYM